MSACKFAQALAASEALRDLEGLGGSADSVAAFARGEGTPVSASQIRYHRRGECSCSNAEPEPPVQPRILTIDIETSPNVAHVWGLFKQTVSLSQLRESGQVIAFAAKWLGEDEVEFRSDFHDGHAVMVERAHALLTEADLIVTYNGVGFDMKHLRREFVLAGMAPPAPWKDVDLLNVVKGQFRFVSNKLDHIAQMLGIGAKVSHTGHDLWVRCMAGDEDAWDTMRTYNIGDVVLTEEVYLRLRPWIKGHPHMGLYLDTDGVDVCGRCGSTDLQPVEATAKTPVSAFPMFRCGGCGSYHRDGRRERSVNVRPI